MSSQSLTTQTLSLSVLWPGGERHPSSEILRPREQSTLGVLFPKLRASSERSKIHHSPEARGETPGWAYTHLETAEKND